ncbi:rab-GTPase-TBC domain-containing protein [Phaeosphaeria sp. MPI-PUGE-AT-0046c]|nr:rab-GTPase-TBC domain-containing protein [Phaeosphaeria sp. MPI-PUGE-AT-0046c]
MPSTVFQHAEAGADNSTVEGVHFIAQHRALYIISEHDYVHSLNSLSKRDDCAAHAAPRTATTSQLSARRRPPRPLMAALTYSQDAHTSFGGPPGSPPDLTNSKSSKSSSFHSSNHSDFMGNGDLSNLSHFEDINLDEASTGPSVFPIPLSPSNRVLYESSRPYMTGGRSLSHPHPAHSSVRDLTSTSKQKYPNLKGHVSNAAQRSQTQLAAPGKQFRRGFTSPSAPTLSNLGLTAPNRSSRSPSPSNSQKFPSAPRTLSRKSSRNMDAFPSPGLNSRRQSWQDAKRKTVKEREAECDDEDDELPEDAVVWNIPISPRPVQERTPSSCGSMASPDPSSAGAAGPSSRKPSPAPSLSRYSPQPSPNSLSRDNSPPTQLVRQPTNAWEETYTNLDSDAKIMTEALEVFQSEFERKQEVKRQQPGLARSASLSQPEPKAKKPILPPVRKSDPLIDPFQPSVEKQKYLSRTRPSWLPPKNPKEEKKHLKEYQKMLARIEEAERLEAQRAQDEALAREKATRIKAEYWSTLLLPNWATEMANPELCATHRKMWWNGIPPRLRGQVWSQAIGNDLEVSSVTYTIALEKAPTQPSHYAHIVSSTTSVFADLKMFAPEQPLHTDLVNICRAYASYRPDISASFSSIGIQHIAALFLLNLPAASAFIVLCNLLNRALPLSFLVHDQNSMHAAYSTTIHALSKKHPQLASRLEQLRVEPRDYLADMFSSLFCSRLGVEHAARVMDLYVIEGDKIPPRVAVAVMGILETACLVGSREEVAGVLRDKSVEMEVEEFMARVYEAGKI